MGEGIVWGGIWRHLFIFVDSDAFWAYRLSFHGIERFAFDGLWAVLCDKSYINLSILPNIQINEFLGRCIYTWPGVGGYQKPFDNSMREVMTLTYRTCFCSYWPCRRSNLDATACSELRYSSPWWVCCSHRTWARTYRNNRYGSTAFHPFHGNRLHQTAVRIERRRNAPCARSSQALSHISGSKTDFSTFQ